MLLPGSRHFIDIQFVPKPQNYATVCEVWKDQ